MTFMMYNSRHSAFLSRTERLTDMDYQDINAQTIDRWIREGWEWGKPISHEVYEKAVNGEWDVYLTPTKTVPHEWLGSLKGKKILGFASGGGQQMWWRSSRCCLSITTGLKEISICKSQ